MGAFAATGSAAAAGPVAVVAEEFFGESTAWPQPPTAATIIKVTAN
jgi:hypothetical protein